jgi:hypothetical protein
MTALDLAWQAALAAEQQAAFGYALLGPQLTGTQQQLAVSFSDAHESLRDATSAAVARAGLTPVPPRADYPSLYPVADAASARRLAIRLEDNCAAAWRYLYLRAASSAGAHARTLRGQAQNALTASAVRATQWRAVVTPSRATTPFPGI